MSSLEECLFQASIDLLLGFWFFWCWVLWTIHKFWYKLLVVISFANIFSLSICCLFIWPIVLLVVQKLLMRSHSFFVFASISFALRDRFRSLLGLLAKIKCSICSYQFNIWYVLYLRTEKKKKERHIQKHIAMICYEKLSYLHSLLGVLWFQGLHLGL